MNCPSNWFDIRLGTAAATTRGFNHADFTRVGNLIADAIESGAKDEKAAAFTAERVRQAAADLCAHYPIYSS